MPEDLRLTRQPLVRYRFWTTLRHALFLNADFYENTRCTRRSRRIALGIVLLAAFSHMLGSSVILLINRASPPVFGIALLLDGLSVVAGYYLWTFVVFKVGQWLKPIDPTYRDLLSPIGFAYAPQSLNFLTLMPLLGRAIELVLAVWSLLSVIVAVREGLDVRNRTATVISLMGWVPIQVAIGFVQVLEQQLVRFSST